MMDWTIVVAALITALLGGGGIAAFLNSKNTRRQIDIDAWCKLIEQQSLRIDTLNERVNLLEAQVAARDIRIDELEQEIDDLIDWIKAQGLKPPPRHRKRNPVG